MEQNREPGYKATHIQSTNLKQAKWKSFSLVHEILQARILEWVAVPFCRGSSQPRNRTRVSPIADRFFTSWATRESPILNKGSQNTQWEKDILFNKWFWKSWIFTCKRKKEDPYLTPYKTILCCLKTRGHKTRSSDLEGGSYDTKNTGTKAGTTALNLKVSPQHRKQ